MSSKSVVGCAPLTHATKTTNMGSHVMSGRSLAVSLVAVVIPALFGDAARGDETAAKPGARVERKGDEIVVAGQLFHTTAPVVTWMDPGGYDAYRVERRFVPLAEASWPASKDVKGLSPNRYGMRTRGLPSDVTERVRGGGWDLDTLRGVVDQFVIHFDVAGTSRRCFQVLHDQRGLSVHFMLDLDGTLYQTLDLKEAAWHATIANTRSVGIEISNVGAYPLKPAADEPDVLSKWYKTGPDGHTLLTIPGGIETSGERTRPALLRPIRDEPVVGEIQGKDLRQYDLTPQQYDSLIKLTATLCTIFPKITCDYPRDAAGKLVPRKLADETLKGYHGLLGHYHVQTNKVDPGPAFQWDTVINGARKLMAR
jgi:N-acetylmuramoyl-L-alanine amidase